MSYTPVLLDGKALSKEIEESLKKRVANIIRQTGVVPVLATVLVGNDPSSEVYVKMKGNACERVGMKSLKLHLPEETTTGQLLAAIDKLNNDDSVCGILLQHPVPAHINERECFDRIAAEKDVDGVTCHGFGRMAMNEPAFGSATPAGIMKLIKHYNLPIEGKHAVVVGRSPILGKPVAMMLLNENATVTICHSKTEGLPEIVKGADIVVGAVGKPEFIKADWIKDNAIVIDAGYHAGGIGDIEISKVKDRAMAYTPVPGGVGPMTIATLIMQNVESAEIQLFKNIKLQSDIEGGVVELAETPALL
ncbi:bifunctional methylenetetrahydrofolate dehydrogenase/methenyltetrahydrofolate cyclohydrolase FolD [Fulvivirga kasyanovii]|uniref:Bifunctional protein FolD n=1 Tax=Fulvivirga kasyanovii TaxID=396812 RepID=A0ABW9RNK9_9BACT|nr:tetrahydrofolate dehydrogenase/cyclohydrolase catalytic domain-containing protein [Fulvivirga kasyanovii]MTI25603.1 bifunctional 5,10-methylene-tetrahydrofolate dehydrogenase/5,10-methylene-tetrahydrofolate cyclohydrolase [Fulvivirga kasyanovii]